MRLWCGFQPEVASQRLPLLWDCHPRIPGQVDPTLGTTGSTGTDQGTDTSISGRTFTSRCGRPDPSGLRALALIAAGGELASRDGVTGWPEQAAYRAAAMRWQAWWTQQQATEMSTHAQILTQVRRFFEQKEARRFADWAADSPKMEHAAGFRH